MGRPDEGTHGEPQVMHTDCRTKRSGLEADMQSLSYKRSYTAKEPPKEIGLLASAFGSRWCCVRLLRLARPHDGERNVAVRSGCSLSNFFFQHAGSIYPQRRACRRRRSSKGRHERRKCDVIQICHALRFVPFLAHPLTRLKPCTDRPPLHTYLKFSIVDRSVVSGSDGLIAVEGSGV